MFYIYVYLDPLIKGIFEYDNLIFNYKPFYVGKGKKNRMLDHLIKAKRKNFLKELPQIEYIRNILLEGKEPIILKLYDNISENDAFILEKEVINRIGYKDGPLVNRTGGGQGPSGKVYNNKEKENLSNIIKNTWLNADSRRIKFSKMFKDKSIEEIHGKEKADSIKASISKSVKEYHKDNPGALYNYKIEKNNEVIFNDKSRKKLFKFCRDNNIKYYKKLINGKIEKSNDYRLIKTRIKY